jgi:DNA-binding NarL/FixJ family response regulator
MSILSEELLPASKADAKDFQKSINFLGTKSYAPSEEFIEGSSGSEWEDRRPISGGRLQESQVASGTAEAECIAVIEPRQFLRECILQGLQPRFPHRILSFSKIEEFESYPFRARPRLVVVVLTGTKELDAQTREAAGERLAALASQAPIVVLASPQDPQLMRCALAAGVKGFIPMSIGFDLAIEAVRFILAGGTYVPVEFLMNSTETSAPAPLHLEHPTITAREMRVVRAIKQGKSNKLIAYELSMCESTVKVHVRHIMKKLGAKNRTAVAMYALNW